jgi:ubiquitin-conjugating enzyme E2 J2
MLSDEMTTGSITTSDADKTVYASRSHTWNLQQRRFRDAFPEVSTRIRPRRSLCPTPDIVPPQWTGFDRASESSGDLLLLLICGLLSLQYCTLSRRPLPNMGEKERGSPETASSTSSADCPASLMAAACLPSSPTPKLGLPAQPLVLAPKTGGIIRPRKGRAVSTTGAGDGSRGWAATWRQVVWDKWRWGVLIALAVIVSRITTSA